MRRTTILARPLVCTALVATIAIAAIRPPSTEAAVIESARPISGRYLVGLDPLVEGASGRQLGASRRDLGIAARKLVRPLRGKVKRYFRRVFTGFSARLTAEAAEALTRQPGVLWVAEDGAVQIEPETSPDATAAS